MTAPKKSFNSVAAPFTKTEKIVSAIVFGGAAALLALDLAIMPWVMAGKLDSRLKDAVAANDGQKVEQVLQSRYADSLWENDEHGNGKREYLGKQLCAATSARSAAAVDAILKNDPDPYKRIYKGYGNWSIFPSDYVEHDASRRSCSFEQALRNADTASLDAYYKNGIGLGGYDDAYHIAQSKELIEYFLGTHADKLPGARAGSDNDMSKAAFLGAVIYNGASAENALYAIDLAGIAQMTQRNPDNANEALRGAILRGDGDILSALLKQGANPNANLRTDGYTRDSALMLSLKKGSPATTKLLVAAGADADAVIRLAVKGNQDPAALPGWDHAVKTAANDDSRQLAELAARTREILKTPKPATP